MNTQNTVRKVETDSSALQDDQLAEVSGGIIAVLIGLLLPDVKTPPPPTGPRL